MTATIASRSSTRARATGPRAAATARPVTGRFAGRRSAARMMRQRKLRVLILMDQDLVPPNDAAAWPRADLHTAPWKLEYDVSATVVRLQHGGCPLGASDHVHPDVIA